MIPFVASFSARKLDNSGSPESGVTSVMSIFGFSSVNTIGFKSGIFPLSPRVLRKYRSIFPELLHTTSYHLFQLLGEQGDLGFPVGDPLGVPPGARCRDSCPPNIGFLADFLAFPADFRRCSLHELTPSLCFHVFTCILTLTH